MPSSAIIAESPAPSVPLADLLGTNDEGILFGALVAVVFLFVFIIEYVRTMRLRDESKSLRKEQYANAAVWGVMLTMAAGGAVIAPNDRKRRDISILLTIGASLQLLSFALLWVAPRRSCPDLTLPRAQSDFASLMAACLTIRVGLELMYNGYLPIDRTGDGCIQILESLSLMITLRGLYHGKMSKPELKRVLRVFAVCCVCGMLCFGELDGSPVADKAFSISIFCEVAAWVCMARYVKGRGRDAVNSMFLPPVFVQAMCRAYFWYMAYPETTIRTPVHIIQVQFPWVLLCCHLCMAVLALGMSVLCVREFNPSLPHKLLCPESFTV
jgi:hypothetical protein